MNRKIPVYKYERELGLAEIVETTASITHHSKKAISRASGKLEQFLKKNIKLPELAIATNRDQIDLFYFGSILVTTNWNLNDDVFGREEVWAARKSPEDKPINISHRHEDIVGHITSCLAVDADTLKPLDDSLALADLPKKFHLMTGGVLYRYWRTEELRERMEEIFAKIEEDKEYVSMEVLFSDFDYAVKRADGSTGVVVRNDETSFLTKHLRAYKGSGEYKGMRIGRYPRQLVFSGKALTENPANSDENGPISVIFDAEAFDELFLESTAGEIQMSVELEAKVTELNQKLEQANAEVQVKVSKIAEVEAALKVATESLAEANTKYTDAENKLAESIAKVGELNTKLRDLDRVNGLVADRHTKENAEAIVAKYATLDDALFAEVAKLHKVTEAKVEDEEVEADPVLDTAKPNADAALSSASASESDELAKELSQLLNK